MTVKDHSKFDLEIAFENGDQIAYIVIKSVRVAKSKQPVRSAEEARRLAEAYVERLRANENEVARSWESTGVS